MNTTVILITLVSYKVLLIAIGFWAQRRTKDTADFFLGGRELGPVVAAVSYSASAASAWTLLGMSGVTYMLGLSAIWIALGAIIGCAIAWLWIGPRLMDHSRTHNSLTLTEFLLHDSQGKYRQRMSIFASAIILISFVFYISSQFQGAGNTFSTSFNISNTHSIVLGGVIIMLYTLLGGFWAVSLTDTLQGFLMAGTAIVLPITAFIAVGGGGDFFTKLAAVSNSQQLSLTGEAVGLVMAGVIAGNLAIGIGTFGQPHLLNRFMAIKNKKAMRQAQAIAISWYTLVFFGMFVLGLCGRILVPEIDNAETLFFRLTTDLFPPILGAMLLAAVLSAIMSTADSMLLVAASTVAHDLALARRFPGKELWISRAAIALLCALAIAVAILLPASIFQRVLFAWIAIGSAFGPLVFARLMHWQVSPGAALSSMVTGFGLAVTLYFLPNTPGDVGERLLPFVSAFSLLAINRYCTSSRG